MEGVKDIITQSEYDKNIEGLPYNMRKITTAMNKAEVKRKTGITKKIKDIYAYFTWDMDTITVNKNFKYKHRRVIPYDIVDYLLPQYNKQIVNYLNIEYSSKLIIGDILIVVSDE